MFHICIDTTCGMQAGDGKQIIIDLIMIQLQLPVGVVLATIELVIILERAALVVTLIVLLCCPQ